MSRVPVRVISDHRITIPQEYRDTYQEIGDHVLVHIEPMQDDESNPYSHAKKR